MMASSLHLQSDDSVDVRVTHSNMKSFSADMKFSLQTTVASIKEKIWRKCGTSVDYMSIELYDDTGAKVCVLDDDTKLFGFYSPQNGYRLHVIDLDPSSVTSGGWLEDTSLVEKYTISEEAYSKLDGTLSMKHLSIEDDPKSTYRKFKEKLVPHKQPNHDSSKIPANYLEEMCAGIKVGDRCQVEPGEKRGVVKFVGKAELLAPGIWVGIQYDEPLGKHDGMVKGTRYFQCPLHHGGMVRPEKVKVGDYPERDPFEEDEI